MGKLARSRKSAFQVIGTLVLVISFPFEAAGQRPGSGAVTDLVLKYGFTEDGSTTSEWLETLSDRHDQETLAKLRVSRKSLTDEERLWVTHIEKKIPAWLERIESLRIPFPDVTPPKKVKIILGNQGGEDAFIFGKTMMCFDVSRLYALYGSATKAENDNRIDRFFSHEFTHLLHKEWRDKNGLVVNTPFEYALWDCLTEGLGNYRSLSSRWVSEDGRLTKHAEKTLQELQPIFVERMAALRHATEAESEPLLAGLSSGPFNKKWGALTVALWLAREVKGNDYDLRGWVDNGPKGVLVLAEKHLPDDLKTKLPKIE